MPLLLIGHVPCSKFFSPNPLSLNETGFVTLTLLLLLGFMGDHPAMEHYKEIRIHLNP